MLDSRHLSALVSFSWLQTANGRGSRLGSRGGKENENPLANKGEVVGGGSRNRGAAPPFDPQVVGRPCPGVHEQTEADCSRK